MNPVLPMAILSRTRAFLTDTQAWRMYRRHQLEADYLRRSARYREAEGQGFPHEADLADVVRRRLEARGWRPERRQAGDIHTFAVIPTIGWHPILLHTLQELGPVTSFTFDGEQCFWRHGCRRDWPAIRVRTNEEIFQEIGRAHRERPVDWVFFYTEGLHLMKDTVRRIQETYGIPTVMMCLDDKQSWEGKKLGGQWTGQVDLAPEFDLYWTSARACCAWVAGEGGRPLYMPEGCDPVKFRPMRLEKDIDVSFVGGAYGFRKDLIRFLKKWGVPVRVFGPMWGTGVPSVWGDDLVRVFNRSRINLGHGGIGYSEDLTNVKTRDFEVPATGGGVYMTTFSSDLAQHYAIGEEIACYHGREELVSLIHHYLQRPALCEEMARRARERCVREHRWSHRYIRILQLLGVLGEQAAPPPLPVERMVHGA